MRVRSKHPAVPQFTASRTRFAAMLVDGLWNLLHCLAKPFLCGVAGFPEVDLPGIATIWLNSRLHPIQVRIRPHLAHRSGPPPRAWLVTYTAPVTATAVRRSDARQFVPTALDMNGYPPQR